ncbi:FtsK/SpoIIIE domain-containing protein [Marisediminicola sp. LYQ85]|uniref:FtsK/SpoIIIE domain-containing protein n=1 Tax=Marisediminicola sp. LYQ85 TaxID=3391062 RepID=UPI0039839726
MSPALRRTTGVVSADTVVLPDPVVESAPYTFPVLATVAPVAGSLVIWSITSSPFALVFAALGPLVALASFADSRWSSARARRMDRARFALESELAREHIESAHDAERARLLAEHAPIHAVVTSERHDDGAWPPLDHFRPPPLDDGRPGPLLVSVGAGIIRSTIKIETSAARRTTGDPLIDELRRAAGSLERAPVVVDASAGIAILARPIVATAVARAIVARILHRVDPASAVIAVSGDTEGEWDWLREGPHRVAFEPTGTRTRGLSMTVITVTATARSSRESGGGADLVAVFVPRPGAGHATPGVPRTAARILLESRRAHRGAVIDRGVVVVPSRGGGDAPTEVAFDLVGVDEAVAFARSLRSRWESEAGASAIRELPTVVGLADARAAAPGIPADIDTGTGTGSGTAASATLACAIGVRSTPHGQPQPWIVDLVHDGPHAVIGGTTGSGKSELLVSWIVSMCTSYPPACVTVLLVDFKGGAAFDPVRGLPHCVGVVTDLDRVAAKRALESLRAEVHVRERALLAAGAKTIDAVPPSTALPRLVIAVDEFAALARDFVELHDLFTDLTARGRSLGIHLILCTQRPAHSLKDAIMANCSLRISLRVTSAADSSAVVGTPDAATLPRRPAGRALVSAALEPPETVHVASTSDADIARARAAWPGSARPRRPWCDPLPGRISIDEVRALGSGHDDEPAGSSTIGLLDVPEEQDQPAARWHAEVDGALLVLGSARSGKTTALRALRPVTGERLWVETDTEAAWDVVSELAAAIAEGSQRPALLVVDDLDALIASFGREHEAEFVDRLATVIRSGARWSIHVALGAQRASPAISALVALCGSTLLLRASSAHEHVLWGGRSEDYDGRANPGRGIWRGHAVQIVHDGPPAVPVAHHVHEIAFDRARTTAVVTTRRAEMSRRLAGVEGVRVVDLASVVGAERDARPPRVTNTASPDAPGSDIDVQHAGVHSIVIGEPEQWFAAGAVLSAMRGRVTLVFDHCSSSEYRSLARSTVAPPPLDGARGRVWSIDESGRTRRARLPGPADG